ncbi:uncharacterized protein LTHEOB_2241 [Lasiodiplodia theobromae]|uniref:uncharacterized protein n=1 Tax=Lasiodiplodia theobromae TaxID=45133 RepID=UPI0015C35509|nr:uncharacterized protein LTHEOB_2241 [Lasiodiplodia theobromae]KAF4536480.1 hypothetical protein LTHEOB_2241 [Lasiodiplodia theobromae]
MATLTNTQEDVRGGGGSTLRVESSLPPKLPSDFLSDYPKLSNEQAGYLRHFHNLATQPDGEWRHMGTQDPGQEWLDAYRYQLAVMAYAAGASHYHRLPALRSVFKQLLEQLIHKMLRREVWGYWYLTSQSGKFVDPDIVELRKPWSDPNKQENIMYSGHLLLMVSLHAMLFDDDKYDEPGALEFVWDPIFWGFGPEKFAYSRSTLQQAILAEMEREKWKGIIAMRYNDVRQGTAVADKVLNNYAAAWGDENGFLQEDKFFINWYMVKQDRTVDGGIGFTAWACAFMNSWNSDFVHSLFPAQSLGFLTHAPGGRINLNNEKVAQAIRKLTKSEDVDPYAWDTLEKARKIAAHTENKPAGPFPQPLFGYVAQWVSEVGDQSTCDGLLCHADEFLNPSWDQGGLFYPRNNTIADNQGNWTYVDPFTGNAAIAYASLNVPDGQREMWQKPWAKEHFSQYPFVDGIGLDSGVDFLRGAWEGTKGVLIISMRTWDGSKKTLHIPIRNLPIGQYGVYKNGFLVDTLYVSGENISLEVAIDVGAQETDLVLLKAR